MKLPQAKKSNDIGMKRGRLLGNLTPETQLDLIAEGLPILMKSAGNLLGAARALDKHHRSATILEGHALEEIAKILILIDIVRCPAKIRSSRIGAMMTWFYDHLARLIYVDAQYWKPVNVKQLQEYADDHRKSHYLEGSVGEYIMPNWTTWSRESMLYADIVAYEDGSPLWNEPHCELPIFDNGDPAPWKLCVALQDVGVFSRSGLDLVSAVWSKIYFKDDQHWSDTETLTHEMLIALQTAGLITAQANDAQVNLIYESWQLPMYQIDFKRLEVPLAELIAERDANFWS